MPTSANETERATTRHVPQLARDLYVGHRLAVFLGCVAFLTAGCVFGGREAPRFVDATETAALARTATGCLLINQSWDAAQPDRPRILAVSLPDLRQTVVHRQHEPHYIWSVAGPDRQGRIALVESDLFGEHKRHTLKTIRLDGSSEDLVFDRPGDPLREQAIGQHLALSPTAGLVAFMSDGHGHQLPSAYMIEGPLEIWDVEKKTGRSTGIVAVDAPWAWAPDGRRLAYVSITTGQDPVLGVSVLDLTTRTTRFLHRGGGAMFSADGHDVLVLDKPEAVLVDVETGTRRRWLTPRGWQAPVAMLPNHLLLFVADPTRGTAPRWLRFGSFKSGHLMEAVKLGDLSNGAFQTVVPYSDFRDEMSFGTPDRLPESSRAGEQ